MKSVNDLFANLDQWRHLPAYQLERRADIFFSIYLNDLIKYKLNIEIVYVVPEFPVRIGTIHPETDTNKSFKIDYLAIDKLNQQAVFVELKTDDGSRRDKQDWYLQEAKKAGLDKLVKGIEQICQATIYKKKYLYLLRKLQEAGLIILTPDNKIIITAANHSLDILYIQPSSSNQDNVISFMEAASIIEKHGDELSLRFAQSLREWSLVKAGDHSL